jgi:hypothetical protein
MRSADLRFNGRRVPLFVIFGRHTCRRVLSLKADLSGFASCLQVSGILNRRSVTKPVVLLLQTWPGLSSQQGRYSVRAKPVDLLLRLSATEQSASAQ